MVSPGLDAQDQPFSYPSQSVDEVGAMFAPSAAELTPDGALYTGFGELMLFAGVDRAQLNDRVRSLEQGYLPVVSFEQERDGLVYTATFLASTLANGQVLNFAHVSVRNPGPGTRKAFVSASWRFTGPQTTTFPTGDNRFRRPLHSDRVGDFNQPGVLFNPQSTYAVQGVSVVRDGRVVYQFPAEPSPQLSASYRDYYNRRVSDDPAVPLPNTPMTTAEYTFALAPGQERSLDFKVPLLPPLADSDEARAVAADGYGAEHDKVLKLWKAEFQQGMEIETAEPKVNDLFRASLTYCLLALNHVGDNWIQTINQFQYHRFYLRDTADFVRMYDTTGYSDLAAKVLDFYPTRQSEDGNFISQPGQYDGWGLAVWSLAEHFRMTHDRGYADRVLPRIEKAVEWLAAAIAQDPLHLVPATDVRDNEYVPGHLTGYNFLALDGLDAAIKMARALGQDRDAERFEQVRDTLRTAFLRRLAQVTASTGGYIPPALDGGEGGTDWGNLLSLVPEQQLAPNDPRVTATLREAQARYQEGLITYAQPGQGTYLHHYLTIKNTLTELIRGEDEQAIRELDAVLVHTTSTNAGWEYSIRPWGNRDFSGNLTPHGWFAADYRNLLRNMLVREEGDQLHLLSAVSPAWIGAGKTLTVRNADTYFGRVSFELAMPSEQEAILTLHTNMEARYAAHTLVLHLPWFERASTVSVDGHTLKVAGRSVALPPDAQRVVIAWRRQPLDAGTPASYDDAVHRYKAEYRKRYQAATGAP